MDPLVACACRYMYYVHADTCIMGDTGGTLRTPDTGCLLLGGLQGPLMLGDGPPGNPTLGRRGSQPEPSARGC